MIVESNSKKIFFYDFRTFKFFINIYMATAITLKSRFGLGSHKIIFITKA